jgi:hypothetical protein
MAVHRFRSLLEQSPSLPAVSCGFMPCPMLPFAPAQLAFVQEVYRFAWERTEAQLRSERPWPPAFSLS